MSRVVLAFFQTNPVNSLSMRRKTSVMQDRLTAFVGSLSFDLRRDSRNLVPCCVTCPSPPPGTSLSFVPRRRLGTLPAPLSRLSHGAGSRWPARMAVTSSSTPGTGIQEGYILEFKTQSGARRLGAAVRPDGKKNWIVEDQLGNAQSISPKQVAHVLGPSRAGGGPDALVDELAETAAQCEQRVAENEELLELAWEILAVRDDADGGATATLTEIAEMIFDETTRDALYAAHVMLASDRVWFKAKVIKGVPMYEAKSENNVQSSKALIEAEARKREEEEKEREAVVSSVQQRDPGIFRNIFGEEMFNRTVDALEVIAEDFGGPVRDEDYVGNLGAGYSTLDESSRAAAKVVLGALGKPILPSNAFDVLVAWRVFTAHENLALRRAGLRKSLEFGSGLLSAADALIRADAADIEDVDAGARKDFSALDCYAVDSAETDEIDDALSWDPEDGRAWVHIADPTRYFPGDYVSEPLFQEALRRSTTLYLPTGKYTMFPPELASQKFSLCGDEVGAAGPHALSFGFKLNSDGSIDYESMIVVPSILKRPQRMTYEQVDDLLDGEPSESEHPLYVLEQIAKRRFAFRIEDGAIDSNSPFSKVYVSNPDSDEPSISVGLSETNGRSWLLVSELMIAACSVAGEFGERHNIPLMYRGQDGFEYPSDDALEEIPAGPARNAAIFKNATPLEVLAEPVGHASLGLDAYVQVTSPIRRSGDLLAHLQLKASLRGETLPLDKTKMEAEIARSMDAGRKMRSVDQDTSKYWHLEYLRRLGPQYTHEAIYVRPLRDEDDRRGLVYICESGFQTVANVPSDSSPGDRLALRMTTVEPRNLFSRATATSWEAHEASKKDAEAFEKELDDLFSDVTSQDESGGESEIEGVV